MRNYPIAASLCLAVASTLPMTAQTASPHAQQLPHATVTPAATAKPGPKAPAALLPSAFAGWEAGASKTITDPAQADPANAAALKEYGFTDALSDDYTRDGQTIQVKALRFEDASGAYGAYSFYRKSGWPREQIGAGAASDHNRILFWTGNVVIDAQVPHVSAMTGSEMRELAAQIPLPAGNKSLTPPILADLPQKDLDLQTTHYALGTAGYTGSGGVLPPELVGFDRGAETATASYKLQSGPATLTLISYPTPEMAAAQVKAIAAYLKDGNTPQHPFTKPLQESNLTALEVRRSGPLVALVSGDPIQEEAHKLLDRVHYEADMSPVPGQRNNDIQKTAQLIVGTITLVVVMFVAAVMLALFLGGGRALYRKVRGRPVSSVYDEEFTSLDLGD